MKEVLENKFLSSPRFSEELLETKGITLVEASSMRLSTLILIGFTRIRLSMPFGEQVRIDWVGMNWELL